MSKKEIQKQRHNLGSWSARRHAQGTRNGRRARWEPVRRKVGEYSLVRETHRWYRVDMNRHSRVRRTYNVESTRKQREKKKLDSPLRKRKAIDTVIRHLGKTRHPRKKSSCARLWWVGLHIELKIK